MTRKTRLPVLPEIDRALRAAFEAVETAPTPDTLKAYADRLTRTPWRRTDA